MQKMSSDITQSICLSDHLIHEYRSFLIKKELVEISIDEYLYNPLTIQLKAFITKFLLKEDGYYEVLTKKQPIITRAVSLISKENEHWDKLSQRIE